MNKTSGTSKEAADKLVRGIKRKTRKHYSAEEKIRIVLAGLRGEESISALCRREGIAESLYYSWSKEFLEAGKNRLAGDTARQATSPEVKELRSESAALKEVVAELMLDIEEPHAGDCTQEHGWQEDEQNNVPATQPPSQTIKVNAEPMAAFVPIALSQYRQPDRIK